MGVIRKTMSITTFGIVPFRSKKEQLRRADRAYLDAQAELAGEHAAREESDKRLAAAEKRARQAELLALQQAKKADVARGKRSARRRAKAASAIEALEDLVSTATPIVEEKAKGLSRRRRKAAEKATKRAEATAEEARKQARKQAKRAKEGSRRARKKMIDLTDDAVTKGGELAEQARTKATDLVS
jgi:hypothetical protein